MLSTETKRFLNKILAPSLVRRLLIAQTAMMGILWLALIGYIVSQIISENSADDKVILAHAASVILKVSELAKDQPVQLQSILRDLDVYHRTIVNVARNSDTAFQAKTYVWTNGNLLHRSVDADTQFKPTVIGEAYYLKIGAITCQVYAQESNDKQILVALVIPASAIAFGIDPYSTGWTLAPLILSIPLLLIPAWWSVKIALKPWKQLTTEIETRLPTDAKPLQFESKLRELVPLTSAINGLFSRLTQTRSRERDFIADAAHELRTPIAAMRVNAEAMLSNDLREADRELLDGLIKSNVRAGRLVEQLMALTRSESALDSRPMQIIDLEKLLQDCLAQLSPLARAANVDLDLQVQPGTNLLGDDESIRALIDNLVGNAIKYSATVSGPQRASMVVVKAIQFEQKLLFTVTDEGPGIAHAYRERVFDRFYRPAGELKSGSGLGLAIAKAVADRHQASITLKTPPSGKGIVVSVNFDLSRS